MAYDRYENRGGWRDDDRRDRGYRSERGPRGDDGDRGFFERARDEVQSWFGDEDAERRRMQDDREGHPDSARYDRDWERDRGAFFGGGREHRHDRDEHRGGGFFSGGRDRYDRDEDRSRTFGGGQSSSYGRGRDGGDYRNQYGRGGGESGGFGGGDYGRQNRSYQDSPRGESRSRRYEAPQEYRGSGGGLGRDRDDDYRPVAGDYGRGGDQQSYRSGMGGQDYTRSQYGRQEFSQDQARDRGDRYTYGGWGDDDSRRQQGSGRSAFGAAAGAAAYGASRTPHDEHYSSWRQRQIEELDRDYDDYRREHQSKFENEFSGWRQQKQTKRQMLDAIREHNEVLDQTGERIGTVDKVRGDTVILTRNDPEAGGVHRSFSCTLLDRVEDGKIYLTGTKNSIRGQLREERDDGDRGRSGGGFLGGLFGGNRDERRDERSETSSAQTSQQSQSAQSGDGPHILDRSFSGTYDDDTKKTS